MNFELIATIIRLAFIILAVNGLMLILKKNSKATTLKTESGDLLLKLPKLYEIITWVFLIGGLVFFFISPYVLEVETIQDEISLYGILAITLALGVPLLLASKLIKITANDHQLKQTTWYSRKMELSWQEIKSVTFGKTSLQLTLRSETSFIRVHAHMYGFSEFLELMKKHLNEEMYKEALETIYSTV